MSGGTGGEPTFTTREEIEAWERKVVRDFTDDAQRYSNSLATAMLSVAARITRIRTAHAHLLGPKKPTTLTAIIDGPNGPEFGEIVSAQPDYARLGLGSADEAEGRN